VARTSTAWACALLVASAWGIKITARVAERAAFTSRGRVPVVVTTEAGDVELVRSED
jgi:hypothetical protein